MTTKELYKKMAEINQKTCEQLPAWILRGYGIPIPKKRNIKDE